MDEVVFLKLGGSLITDKQAVEVTRPSILARAAAEIRAALVLRPALKLVLGHGSGSFGHVAAAKHGTRLGVRGAAQWRGFAEVSAAALRLNALVREALVAEGLPIFNVSPSVSAEVTNGTITHLAMKPIQNALAAGLIPLTHGDVAFDKKRGGTILSTEEVMSYLVPILKPTRLLLVGQSDGVLDVQGNTIPKITTANFEAIRPALKGSEGTDVTGGMQSKVTDMLTLVTQFPALTIQIFSGLHSGEIKRALLKEQSAFSTQIVAA